MRSSIVVKLWNQKNNTLQGTNISPSPALLSRWFSVSFPFGWDMRSFLWIVIFIDVGCGVSSRMIILKYPENRQDDNFKREKPSWKPFTVGRFPTHQTYRKKKSVFFSVAPQRKKNPAYGVGDWYSPLEVVIWEPLEQPVGCELFGENQTAKNQENECPKEDLNKSIIKPWEWWDRKTGGLEIPEACYTGSNPLHRRVQSLILAGHTKTQSPTSLL